MIRLQPEGVRGGGVWKVGRPKQVGRFQCWSLGIRSLIRQRYHSQGVDCPEVEPTCGRCQCSGGNNCRGRFH